MEIKIPKNNPLAIIIAVDKNVHIVALTPEQRDVIYDVLMNLHNGVIKVIEEPLHGLELMSDKERRRSDRDRTTEYD